MTRIARPRKKEDLAVTLILKALRNHRCSMHLKVQSSQCLPQEKSNLDNVLSDKKKSLVKTGVTSRLEQKGQKFTYTQTFETLAQSRPPNIVKNNNLPQSRKQFTLIWYEKNTQTVNRSKLQENIDSYRCTEATNSRLSLQKSPNNKRLIGAAAKLVHCKAASDDFSST